MLKGAVFTLGIIMAIGSFGYAALSIFASGMSDNPSDNANALSNASAPFGIGLVGIAMIVGAFFIPS